MKYSLVVSVLFIVSFPVQANLYLGGWSTHFSGYDLNNTHHLVAVEHRGWVAGTFVNSFDDRVYLGARDFRRDFRHLSTGIMLGLAYGYDDRDTRYSHRGFVPGAVPYIRVRTPFLIEPVFGLMGNAAFLSFSVNF